MNLQKTCQLKDMSSKTIRINADIFRYLIYIHFSCCIDAGEFPSFLKF